MKAVVALSLTHVFFLNVTASANVKLPSITNKPLSTHSFIGSVQRVMGRIKSLGIFASLKSFELNTGPTF